MSSIVYKILHYNDANLPFKLKGFESQHREKQWMSSRAALYLAIKELSPHKEFYQKEDLEIESFLNLRSDPDILVGLTHTGAFGGAVVGHLDHLNIGLGIDIELSSRKIKSGAFKHFVHPKDQEELIENPLELWCAKEASFKASFPYYPTKKKAKTFVLRDLWIDQGKFGIDNQALGDINYHYETFNDENLLVAIACLRQKI